MYFHVNFNVFFKLIKVHFLVSELYKFPAVYGSTKFINVFTKAGH